MQIFHRSTNTISRATIFGAIFVIAMLFSAAAEVQRSPYVTYAGVARHQGGRLRPQPDWTSSSDH